MDSFLVYAAVLRTTEPTFAGISQLFKASRTARVFELKELSLASVGKLPLCAM